MIAVPQKATSNSLIQFFGHSLLLQLLLDLKWGFGRKCELFTLQFCSLYSSFICCSVTLFLFKDSYNAICAVSL